MLIQRKVLPETRSQTHLAIVLMSSETVYLGPKTTVQIIFSCSVPCFFLLRPINSRYLQVEDRHRSAPSLAASPLSVHSFSSPFFLSLSKAICISLVFLRWGLAKLPTLTSNSWLNPGSHFILPSNCGYRHLPDLVLLYWLLKNQHPQRVLYIFGLHRMALTLSQIEGKHKEQQQMPLWVFH